MWETVLLKKSSNFKTLLSWWKRYSRPPEQQSESFKDIWLLPGDTGWIESRIRSVKRDIMRVVRGLYFDEEDGMEPQEENIIQSLALLFKKYDNSTPTRQSRIDDLSSHVWRYNVTGLKRKQYPNMATDRVKQRKLKQLIPEEFMNRFSKEDIDDILEALTRWDKSRAIKSLLQYLSVDADLEFKEKVIQTIKEEARR